jgi:hypothetical protein
MQSESALQESTEAPAPGTGGVAGAGLGEGTQPMAKANNSKTTTRLVFMITPFIE